MSIIKGNYDDLRDSMKDGQVVFIKGNNLFHRFVKWVTRGNFTHCGMLVWMTDDAGYRNLMVVESSAGGARIVTLRSYVHRGFSVVDINFDWSKYGAVILDATGVTHYSILNFVVIGVKELLLQAGMRTLAGLIKYKSTGEVCSEFIADELYSRGLVQDTKVSPNALYYTLSTMSSLAGIVEIEAQNDIPTP